MPNDTPLRRSPDLAQDGTILRVFPDLAVSAATSAVLLMCVLSVLCIFAPATLDVRADAVTAPAPAKPTWYLLFLHGLARSAPPLVAAGAPALLVALLIMLPYLDAGPARRPRERIAVLALGATVTLAVLGLTLVGWLAS